MNKNERRQLFKNLMNEYTGKPIIMRSDIKKAIGISFKEIDEVIKNLPYFGKRSHYYIIDDVAECLVEHMELNKVLNEGKNQLDLTQIDYKSKKGKSLSANEYWMIPNPKNRR